MPQVNPDLTADLDPAERAELGDLQPLQQRLTGYVAPEPTPADTAALLSRLRPLLAERPVLEPARRVHWLDLARTQVSLFEPAFWWASAAVTLLGLLLGVSDGSGGLTLAFTLAAPALAAAGVAYAFRPAAQGLKEMEQVCPISPLELAYARLGVVLAYDLLLSLLLLGLVAVQAPQLVLWRLILAWLGPMLALAGIALYTSLRWGAIAGAAAPLVLWTGFAFLLRTWAFESGLTVSRQLDHWLLPLVSQSQQVLVSSLAALVLGVILLRHGGRLVAGEER